MCVAKKAVTKRQDVKMKHMAGFDSLQYLIQLFESSKK